MGPNGSGKSTLGYAIMGHPNYEVTERLDHARRPRRAGAGARRAGQAGLFLAFQTRCRSPA